MTDEDVIREWQEHRTALNDSVEWRVEQIKAAGGGEIKMSGLWATGEYPDRWLVILRHLAPEFEWSYAKPEHPLGIVFTAAPF